MRRTLRMKRCDIPLSASSASACHNGPKLLVVVVVEVDSFGSCTLANTKHTSQQMAVILEHDGCWEVAFLASNMASCWGITSFTFSRVLARRV